MLINNQPLFRPSIWDYAKVRKLYSFFVRGRRFQFLRPKVQSGEYVNIGCGPNTNNELVCVDYHWYRGVDLCWDITKPLPWKDATLKGIFSEHCLEHITFADCAFVLKACRRMLMPGGTIRIVVPDGELYLDLYRRVRTGENVRFPYQTPAEVTAIMCVNRIFREFTHIFIYDEETMSLMLSRAGFVNIRRESYMKGRDAKLLLDTEMRAVESLYIEASVPDHNETVSATT